MNSFIDTSFCFSLYAQDLHTPEAQKIVNNSGSLLLSPFVRYEFMQGVRLKIFHSHNRAIGLSHAEGNAVLEDFSTDLTDGLFSIRGFQFEETLEIAKDFSRRYTISQGYRSFDILHVAAAVQMKADRFLTFDATQKKLAKAVGLKC